ncbi:hypothetical protein F511_09698 [Dorcoceras hygrometricum]|uniref:Uncharacterized protein n=1 Tax=Dorcoceras hygrometricum TaxID=472368 RepID=A0A2Z7CPC7_9LAMI|nr:hypothetical protein F511_09698 [Dorcoceras hygrometricum]
MERAKSLGVRKGAWSKEEDALLRKCVQQFGVGRWHLVPLRSGLNRCRKSCRLRWLNYLRPDIRRGNLTRDEIDLLIRLHKLLGNRWSLIAGRIPGRTANDLKNFWNTRMEKKSREKVQPIQKAITKTSILRPRPRNFSKLMVHDHHGTRLATDDFHQSTSDNSTNDNDNKLLPSSSQGSDEDIGWWSNLLDASEDQLEKDITFADGKGEEEGLWMGQKNPAGLLNDWADHAIPANEFADDDFNFEDDVWERLGFGNYDAILQY